MSASRGRYHYRSLVEIEYGVGEREAAEFLGVSRRELVALCERGNGPHHTFVNGRARYLPKDLIQFCIARAAGSKGPTDGER